MPEYSIVIPTFQKKHNLKNTLLAFNHQMNLDFEILVIDDGSTDDTGVLITSLTGLKFPLSYFYLARDERSCSAKTRNYGLQKARGRIVIFLDDDMIVSPDFITEQGRYHQKNGNILLLGGRYNLNHVPEENELIEELPFNNLLRRNREDINASEIRHFIFYESSYNFSILPYPWLFAYSCNMSARKDLLIEIGGFDENYITWGFEDIDLGYRIYKKGVKILYNHKLEAIHQFHGFMESDGEKVNKSVGNISYFLAKFPELTEQGFSVEHFMKGMQEVSMAFTGKVRPEQAPDEYRNKIGASGPRTKKVFKLLHLQQIAQLTALIHDEFHKDSEIIIFDFLENTDLDYDIQVAVSSPGVCKYYPISGQLIGNVLREIEQTGIPIADI